MSRRYPKKRKIKEVDLDAPDFRDHNQEYKNYKLVINEFISTHPRKIREIHVMLESKNIPINRYWTTLVLETADRIEGGLVELYTLLPKRQLPYHPPREFTINYKVK